MPFWTLNFETHFILVHVISNVQTYALCYLKILISLIQDTCQTFPISLDLWIYGTLTHFMVRIVTYLTTILLQFAAHSRLKYTQMISRYMNRTTEAARFCINTEKREAGRQKYEEGFGMIRNKVKNAQWRRESTVREVLCGKESHQWRVCIRELQPWCIPVEGTESSTQLRLSSPLETQ